MTGKVIRRKGIKMAYKSKLKEISKKIEALEEERTKLLRNIVSRQVITSFDIPKTEEKLSECMMKLVGTEKYSWLDVEIFEIFHSKRVFIFGRRRSIFGNIKKIAKIIEMGKGCRIGDVGISFSFSERFRLEDFI